MIGALFSRFWGWIVAAAAGIGIVATIYFRGRAAGGQAQRNRDRKKLDRAVRERQDDEVDLRRRSDSDLDDELRRQRDQLP